MMNWRYRAADIATDLALSVFTVSVGLVVLSLLLSGVI